MRYTAINIGPIVDTISMARKPRELWAASYLFSYLMECIVKEIRAQNKTILSPESISEVNNLFKHVGLYPDRVFVIGMDDDEIKSVVDTAVAQFYNVTGIGKDYVNVMYVSAESANGTGVIKKLNCLLDCAELVNRSSDDTGRVKVLDLIQKKSGSSLFKHATGEFDWNIPTLSEIATYKLSKSSKKEDWIKYCKDARSSDDGNEKAEEEFYKRIKDTFKEEYRSYYKYICVVQADGDNMGKIISLLDKEEVKEISSSLLNYGSEASRMIKAYGGVPIYAGGDDLLFIAPVVSDLQANIFQLLSDIDECYQSTVDKVLDDKDKISKRPTENNKEIHTFVSYGLSISYYKYPLYEALKTARELLFDKAKNVEVHDVKVKNAIAWCLRKHSGFGFIGSFTKDKLKSNVYPLFKELMKYSVDDNLVSAISHKLRANEGLLDILRDKEEDRIAAFYNKIMEEDQLNDSSYVRTTRALLCSLLCNYKGDKEVKISEILSEMYGMLRTAKFINGEGDSNE